jgi:hypothetical protein
MRIPRLFRRSDPLADALAIALDAIAAGATVEQALANAPGEAAELRPLLEASLRARVIAAPEPSDDARLVARAAVLRAAAARRAPAPVTPHPAVRRSGWLALAPAVLAAVVFAGIAVPLVGTLDSGAIPGDWNYGLKRAGERVQLALTTDSTDRRLLRLTFAQRRLSEIEKLSQHGQVDGHSAQVVSLVRDYTVDLSQVQSSVVDAPAVDASTKQAVDKTTQAAQSVLQPIAESAAPAVASPAQTALASTTQTQVTTDSKPTTQSGPQVAKSTTTAAPAAPTQTAAPAPVTLSTPINTSAPTAPPASPSPAPSATVAPTPQTTPQPTAQPTSAPPTSTATQLRPDQVLPAVTFTPAPATTPATPEPSPAAPTSTPAPIIVASAPLFGTATPASSTPTTVPASATATFGPPPRTPSPTPAPVATRPAAALTPAPSSTPVALQPGDNTLRYSGVPLPLDTLLAPILADVVYVSYTDAAGLPHLWYPGTQAPPVGAGNSVFIVRVRQGTTITLP